jgi:Acetyltransferase (GNAT) family
MGDRLPEPAAGVRCQGFGAFDHQKYPRMRGEGVVGKDFIRQATPQDIDALIDIYIECFPERVNEVFGGSHRRVFIRDYLLLYLAWDPPSNWVCVRDGVVVGFIIAPCHYSPWRAMLSHARLFRWLSHFLIGQYGFPIHLVKKFFRGGFAFTSDPAIKRLQGEPYIHLIAVRATDGKEPSRGLLGIGRQLLRWVLADRRRKGIHFCWAVVQPTNSRFIPIWKRIGAKVYLLANGESLALLGDSDDDLRHSECR